MDLTSVPKSIDDALRVQRKYVILDFNENMHGKMKNYKQYMKIL